MTDISIQHVYARRSDYRLPIPTSSELEPIEGDMRSVPECVSVRHIMTRDVVCVHDDLDVETAIELVTHRHIGCLPVVDGEGFPIGMVTKLDLLEQTAARGDGPAAMDVRELMMPIAFTLDHHATVAHAAMMMHVEGVHHVPIVGGDGRLIGLVSSLDIVRWLATADRP